MSATVIEELPSTGFFKFKPDQLFQVRKMFNLEKPGMVKEAIQLMRDWVEKQHYFNKKDFSDAYLEILLITCKGSMERAKQRLEKICTFRTIWPQYFTTIDINSFKEDFNIFRSIMLPDATEDYARVNLFKINSNVPLQPDIIMAYTKYLTISCEYNNMHDYPSGVIVLLDYQDVNLLDLLAILTPSLLRQMVSLYMDGYGMRVQGIHLVSTSKMTDLLISLLKQVLSKKISSRIHVHRNYETLYDFIPKNILPAEYGGDAASLNDMTDDFLKELGNKEHMEHMKETQSATVDLSKKPNDSSIDEYVGMSGSFRTLSVD